MTETVNKPQLAARDRCTGCGACSNGCPKGAIRMVPDREGFLYPQVEDGCVLCGHCTHICPVLKQREPRTEPAVFAVWNRDAAARQASTAGGVFSALAEYVLEGGGVVFGAALDDRLRVAHVAVKQRPRAAPPAGRRSRCRATSARRTSRCGYYLDQGRQVLFSGTPCQVDGLYRYLGEHPERLVTCDVACSGVCSPGVWARLVQLHGLRQAAPPCGGGVLRQAQRRSGAALPRPVRGRRPSTMRRLPSRSSGRGLTRGLFLRPACYRCPYAGTDRTGDLTLGPVSPAATCRWRRSGRAYPCC